MGTCVKSLEDFPLINLLFLNLSMHIYFHLGFLNINKPQCLRYARWGFFTHRMESERNSLFLFQLKLLPSEFFFLHNFFFFTQNWNFWQSQATAQSLEKRQQSLYTSFKNAVLNRTALPASFILWNADTIWYCVVFVHGCTHMYVSK